MKPFASCEVMSSPPPPRCSFGGGPVVELTCSVLCFVLQSEAQPHSLSKHYHTNCAPATVLSCVKPLASCEVMSALL